MAEDQGGAGDVGRLVAHAGRDAMIAGRDLTINNLFQGMPPAAARSAYLEQVRRIAPPDPPGLSDRDTELAELASFCLAPEGASYVWLRAGPWAGKSALLSTFVLRPPSEVAQRVRIVSFFITARLAAQDTRESFIQVLLEQLAALLGQSLPAVLPEATQEAYLLGLLSQAASDCKETGKRLVLVVDGLDEDRGVTTGPQAHSIAGLLPARPLDEMRVIVEEAHKQKLKVAAHATTAEGIKNAITAGVDSIEHGFGADRESLEMMKAHGIFLVPTVGVVDAQLELHKNDPISPEGRKKRDSFLQGIQQSLQQALSLGVKMASGFDASNPTGQGHNADQLVAMAKRGIPPLEVIRAATLNAAELMGWQEDVGSVEVGKYADLIAVEGNPLTDIAILQHAEFVMKGGTIVKDAVIR